MEIHENKPHPSPSSSLSLSSRLDRLDLLVKYLERRHESWKSTSSSTTTTTTAIPNTPRSTPATSSPLIDRISSLEHRLVQISMEIEASRAAAHRTADSVGGATHTSSLLRKDSSRPFPVFDNPNRGLLRQMAISSRTEIREQTTQGRGGSRNMGSGGVEGVNVRQVKKKQKKVKNQIATNRPLFLKMLGC